MLGGGEIKKVKGSKKMSNFGTLSGLNIDSNLIGDLSSDENNNKGDKLNLKSHVKIHM